MTLSTSGSERPGKKDYAAFLKWCGVTFTVLFTVVMLFLIIIDPLDNIPFSPPFKRAPIAFNQRFSYPAVARKPYFDSVVIGTSATRQLNPELLNATFHARFANLSMNAATPYEQFKIAELFFRHHPQAKILILGIDPRADVWCNQNPSRHYTFREFPEWMYDENRWNDLPYLFNGLNMEIALKQLGYLLGLKAPTYDINGYADLMKGKPYSLERARQNIYGQSTSHDKPVLPVSSDVSAPVFTFTTMDYLHQLLDGVPKTTAKIIYFVPLHWFGQPDLRSKEGMAIQACKEKIQEVVSSYENVHTLDYMKQSDFTTTDSNYLDVVHITKEAANVFIQTLEADLQERHSTGIRQAQKP